MTATANDEQIIEVFDLDKDTLCEARVACDLGDLGHADRAEWIVHHTPCPQCGRNPKLMCNADKVNAIEHVQKVGAWCKDCQAPFRIEYRVYLTERL